MAEEKGNISVEAKVWIDELENMKGINFFPYLNIDSIGSKEVINELKIEDCPEDNCFGQC